MFSYIFRRILMTVPVILVVALVIFSLLYLTPGDPAAVIAGDTASADDIARIRERLGLDRPFVVQFADWGWRVLHGDLGHSVFTNLPVTGMITQRLEPTLSLTFLTLLLSVCTAIPIGVIAAARNGTIIDRCIMTIAVIFFSVPVFVCGYIFAWYFALDLNWLPVQGYQPIARGVWGWLSHLILPAAALGTAYIALIARTVRATMLDVLQQDYVRTAKAKGLKRWQILFVHALRNASIPVITIVGIGFTLLISGAVVTETVFGIPGVGRLTVDAVLQRDYPVIQGVILVFSILYVLINLIVDITYTIVDPRIRY